MRQITKEIYSFDELSKDAKNNVWDMVRLSGIVDNVIDEDAMNNLLEDFPHSKPKFQHSFASLQGDGCNVYGTFRATDLLEYVKNALEDSEYTRLSVILFGLDFAFDSNSRYSYCLWYTGSEYFDRIIYACKDYLDSDYALLQRFFSAVCDAMMNRCRDIEDDGYAMLLNRDDEWLAELADCNDWEFYPDGTRYKEA